MAKATKKKSSNGLPQTNQKATPEQRTKLETVNGNNSDYAFAMSHAPRIDESTTLMGMLPIIFFSSVVIMMVRMYSYQRPMSQFFWTSQTNDTDIGDFFSYYKMVAIVVCAVLALLMLLFRVVTQSLAIKRCFAYIPMGVYTLFVVLSYICSDYKEFAWFGWNDRFEGTLPIICYMIVLFLVIYSINTEKNVKMILYPLAAACVMLSLLGISQAMDHDFFRTVVGQKLLVPNALTDSGMTTWQLIDAADAEGKDFLDFTFKNKEIYQTVYNVNYVSFYLTLLIPLFGMLFIRSVHKESKEPLWKRIGLGALLALLIFNLIGSASSGGFLGLGVVGLSGIIVLNKQLLKWLRPLAILFLITGLVMGMTADRWVPELTHTMNGVFGNNTPTSTDESSEAVQPGSVRPFIDYFETNEDTIEVSLNKDPLVLQITKTAEGELRGLLLFDADEKPIAMSPVEGEKGEYSINDDRFYDYMTISYASDNSNHYIILTTAGTQWPFLLEESQILYYNQFGRLVDLHKIPAYGFEDNLQFGSLRGYIWSRSFPLLKDTIFIGTGADTYCAAFPQEDYAGKYSAGFSDKAIVVDKPHNMYLHMAIGTGGISLIAMLSLYAMYIVQSIRIYRKKDYKNDYLMFAGAGTFFGLLGFMVTGLVDDSTVSVMPMFYTLLGMGIAINMILLRRSQVDSAAAVSISEVVKQD